MRTEVVVLVGGLFFLLLALVGGGIALKEVAVIPSLPTWSRISAGMLGSVLTALSLWMTFNTPSNRGQAPQEPSPTPPTVSPSPSINRSPEPVHSKDCSANLLTQPWYLEATDGDAQKYENNFDANAIINTNILSVAYDLHGLHVQPGDRQDESAIIFKQPHRPNNWFVVSLANHGTNGKDGLQSVDIPLADFISLPDTPSNSPGGERLDTTKPLLPPLSARFWHTGHFVVDIESLQLCNLR